MQQPILIDVDGVLCNFIVKCVNFVNRKKNACVKYEDVIDDIIKYSWWDKECEKFVQAPGFCSDLPLIEDAQWGVKTLRAFGEKIIFVTSPYKSSPTWCFDRTQWLVEHFQADRDDVILCHDKRYVNGKVLIDDKPKNVYDWEEYQYQPGILFSQPQNVKLGKYDSHKFTRANSWKEVVNILKDR